MVYLLNNPLNSAVSNCIIVTISHTSHVELIVQHGMVNREFENAIEYMRMTLDLEREHEVTTPPSVSITCTF